MEQFFDYFEQPELPYIVLCNPNKEELFSLGLCYDTNIKIRFNALSEFSFVFPRSIDGNQTILEAYEYIQNKRLVLVEGYGYFQIQNSQEDLSGATPIKNVTCQSLETELIEKRVVAYGGTRPLWNIIDSTDTVLGDMLLLVPNWSAGYIDPDLLNSHRTFNISDTNVYNFLMNDVSKAFECIFSFNTVNREINVYSVDNATIETDIFLSFDNVISQASFSEKSDEITTCLAVYGGGDLDIRTVNPLGTDRIYDFSYYKNSNWMSSDLVSAVSQWESRIIGQQTLYATYLSSLKTAQIELLTLQTTLATYQEEYLALQGQQAARIQSGQTYTDITVKLINKQNQINSQNNLINNKTVLIQNLTVSLQEINAYVSFEENFTPSQLLELNTFIYENTYKNENIIQTDGMTPDEVQDAGQSLYNQGANVLDRVSQPRYEFSVDAVNYIFLDEFSTFTNQTEVGCVVTAEIKDGSYISAVLLEISFSFNDPKDFSMTFSNRLRLDNGAFVYSDLMGQVVSTGSSVSFDSLAWSNWETDYKNDVTQFITSSLNASVNNLVSNSNQDIIIDQNGLRARQKTGSTYSAKQMWLVNNMLAFSTDGFSTAKLALGEISTPTGGTAYGLVADVIVGRLLAGNTLTITNSNNNFTLDSTGATLNNAKFNIQTTNAKVIIDPTSTVAFRIQKNQGGTFVDRFWVDNAGNVNFSGNLTGATGTFSGTLSASVGNIGTLVIDSNGLKTADGNNFLRGNGDLKWGSLSIIGGTATFSGTIYADKIVGQVVNSQISNGAVDDSKVTSGLNAGKVTNGSMSGYRVYGGALLGPGLSLSLEGTGIPVLSGNSGLELHGGSAAISLAGSLIVQSSTFVSGSLQVTGAVYVSGGTGLTTSRSISTPFGNRIVTFSNGILVGFT